MVFRKPNGEWIAHLETGPAGPFMDRELALKVAVIEAARLRGLGQPARVAVADENGEVLAVRCLCEHFGR